MFLEYTQRFSASIATPILTGSKTMVYEKLIDFNDYNQSFTINFGEFSNSMVTANVIIELNSGLSSIKLVIESIRYSKSFNITIPQNSMNQILEIYASSSDINKGSMVVRINKIKNCPPVSECNKCPPNIIDCQTICKFNFFNIFKYSYIIYLLNYGCLKGRECYQVVDTSVSIFYDELNDNKCSFEHCTECPLDSNGCRYLCKAKFTI